jgi:hypothetical protein
VYTGIAYGVLGVEKGHGATLYDIREIRGAASLTAEWKI